MQHNGGSGLEARAQVLAGKLDRFNGSASALLIPAEARQALAELAGLVVDMAKEVDDLKGVCFGE